ncbi:MAG: dicarboxylate/amino acid:cation symporter [Desulfurococcales archaeon ex4484_42]|nr:MAG: dicarboxylate/amino acid:cation symporter [Desulfurococcales archaeon ex4484_42]
MGFWQRYLSFPVIYKIAIGFILGIIAGLLIGPPITVIKPLGDFFMRLLKMIVIPLIFFTLVLGSASIDPKKLGKAGGLIVVIYVITSFIAVSIGLAVGLAVHPGLGFTLPGVTYKPPKPVSFIETILSWIPTNPFGAMAQFQVIPTIIFALFVGIALAYLRVSDIPRVREAAETTYRVFDALSEVMYKIVKFVLEVAPYGVFALIAVIIGKTGVAIFIPYAKLIGAEALGIAIQIGVVYTAILLISGINPVKFFGAASEAMLTAFVTRSSSGTLPVTMRVADEKLGIDRGLYSFTLPLGATINMDGTAIYMALVAIFAADIVGRTLTAPELATLAVAAVMASVGAAGVPSAGLIMLTVTLTSVGLPLEVIPLIAGIDVILDMMRTMNNVTGDLTVTTAIAKFYKLIDFKRGIWAS